MAQPDPLAALISALKVEPTKQDPKTQKVIEALLGERANAQFGLLPYEPGYNFPQDVGLGGISTEYTATDYDPNGQILNYPQIWYGQDGQAYVLPQQQAYERAISYENQTAKRFPRFNSLGNAETYAENRSAAGGAENTPLASLFGFFGGPRR